MNNLGKEIELDLDENAMMDIWSMYKQVPAILVARDAFISMTLREPFTFQIPKIGIGNSDEMQAIIALYWMDWLKDVYDWLKMFGVCPYMMEKLRDTEHQYPVVPEFGSGKIVTFIDKKHRKRFRWYWERDREHDRRMLWIGKTHAPDRWGKIRSPLSTLLDDYRTIRIMRRGFERANTTGPDPHHIIEFHPSKTNNGDDDLITLEAYGEKSANMVLESQERLRARGMQFRQSDLMNGLYAMYRQNRQFSAEKHSALPLMLSESAHEAWDRENPGFFTKTVPLKPDFRYVQSARPQIFGDLEKSKQNFALNAASIMDYPLETIMPTGSVRGKNETGNTQFMNGKITDALEFFKQIIKNALIIAYGSQIQETLDEAVTMKRAFYSKNGWDAASVVRLHAHLEVHVEMNSTPIMSLDELDRIHKAGYMKKETAGKRIFRLYSLPEEDMHVSEWPDMVPKDLLIKPANNASGVPPKKKAKTTSN